MKKKYEKIFSAVYVYMYMYICIYTASSAETYSVGDIGSAV